MKAVPTRIICRLAIAWTLLIPMAYAAETGYTLKSTDVRDKPFFDATTVATLPEKTVVEILLRQGGWMQIKSTDGKQGWIRLLSVALGSPDKKPQTSGNMLSALSLGSRPAPSTNSTVTTGVRGFSEEDLAKAKPNPAEVEKMKSFAATKEEARALADSGKLWVKQVAYFDEKGKPLKVKK